jgi:hypothetical protein
MIVAGKIILKWIFKKYFVKVEIGLDWLRMGVVLYAVTDLQIS